MLDQKTDHEMKKIKIYLSNDFGPALLIIFVIIAITHRDQINCAVGVDAACAEINQRYEKED